MTGTVLASRIRPVPSTARIWSCWRCGIRVNGQGTHLIDNAPCLDCREALADAGDQTVYDRRNLDGPPPPPRRVEVDIPLLLQLYRTRPQLSLSEIARRLGCSTKTIRRRLRDHYDGDGTE